MKEIRTFLSSPQSFDLIEEIKIKPQFNCKKTFKRKIVKRKTVSKKLLIKNILMEEDFSKLTERQKTLNKRFRNCVDRNKIDDISLINSGIDIIPYNINNTTVLSMMLKNKDIKVENNNINGLDNRLEDNNTIDKKVIKTNAETNKVSTYLPFISSPSPKKTKSPNQPLDKFHYNKLYENSLSRNKTVSPRMSTIKLKNISDIYKIQLPLEKGNIKIRIKIKEKSNHIIRIRLGDPDIIVDEPQNKPCYPIQIYPREESFLKIIILYKKQKKIHAKKCLFISRLCLKKRLALGFTELKKGDLKIIEKVKIGDEDKDVNDLKINNENNNPIYLISPHLTISHSCLMKISMYLEFMQISLKMHKCKFKRFLIEKLKIILENISNSKCVCDIEEDIIKILVEVDQCRKCG